MCLFKINEGIKYSGNTPVDSYNDYHSEINEFGEETRSLIDSLSSNSSPSNNDHGESTINLKIGEHLKSHNSKHAGNIKSSNPTVSRKPTVKPIRQKSGKA